MRSAKELYQQFGPFYKAIMTEEKDIENLKKELIRTRDVKKRKVIEGKIGTKEYLIKEVLEVRGGHMAHRLAGKIVEPTKDKKDIARVLKKEEEEKEVELLLKGRKAKVAAAK